MRMQPAVDAAQPRDGEQRRRLHLDRDGARGDPARRALGVGVVEEVGGGDQHGAAAPRARAPRSAPGRPSARSLGAERAARAVRAQRRARPRAARPACACRRSAPHVPTRTSRRAPSPISSSATIAALGPPMPVLWIVSGAPSVAGARVAPQPAVGG